MEKRIEAGGPPPARRTIARQGLSSRRIVSSSRRISGKSGIRSTKSETNPKSKGSNFQNGKRRILFWSFPLSVI
jgi:hypothetical protein